VPGIWKIFWLTAAVIVAEGSLSAGINDWTNVGPEGGSYWQVVIDPQDPCIIYATTSAGLFKSKDGGASWDNAGLNGFGVYGLVMDPQQPNILYAAATNSRIDEDTIGNNIFKSTDGGASWNESDSGLSGCCLSLGIDPQNTGTLYVLSDAPNRGVFRSTDGGASWRMVYALSGGLYFDDVAIDPNTPGTLYAAAHFMGGGAAIFKSLDGGTSWSEADAGLPDLSGPVNFPIQLAVDPASPATMYATVSGSLLFKTTDGAATWHGAGPLPIENLNDQRISGVVIDPRDSNTLYCPRNESLQPTVIFKSTDGGASWNPSTPVPEIPWIQFSTKGVTIDPRNSSTLYAATSSGVYRSIDGGVTFTPYSRARALPVTAVALSPQRSGTVLAGAGALVLQSTDSGMSWRASVTGLGFGSVVAMAIDPQNPSIAYAGTGDWDCGWVQSEIFRSEDGGASWIDTQSAVDCLSSIVVDPRIAGTVYAGSLYAGFLIYRGTGLGPGVKKSTDGGNSWKDVSSGLPTTSIFEPAVSALAIDPQNTHTLFASECAFSLCALFKSTDGGAHWVGTKPGVPAFRDNEVVAMAVDPQSPSTVYAAIAPFASRNGGLWKSVDGGANWRKVFPSNVYALAIDPRNPATIYFGTDDGLARSTDGGDTWAMIPGGPGRVTVLALDPQDPDTVYAGGQGGLFAIRFAQ
jgi:photosystem II stability/assembly factor-like uncharacterized protein